MVLRDLLVGVLDILLFALGVVFSRLGFCVVLMFDTAGMFACVLRFWCCICFNLCDYLLLVAWWVFGVFGLRFGAVVWILVFGLLSLSVWFELC